MNLRFSFATFATALLTSGVVAAPEVVASIKPIHSMVTAVMAGIGEPTLLVRGAASPHTYALKPSDAAALESADLVFWTGHGMELFLSDALDTLSTDAQIVELAKSPGIRLLSVREGGAFEAHEEEAASKEEEGEADMHFWLDPENAKLMVTHIAATLSAADPQNAQAYNSNAQTEIAALDQLAAELTATLAPVKDKPFVVFHDAYQYFENRFGLTLAGSITVSPETAPGAARIDELKSKIAELGATCVFSEPNFQPTIINAIIEGSAAEAGVLDPEGGALAEGPDLYANLLRGLATSLVDCLG